MSSHDAMDTQTDSAARQDEMQQDVEMQEDDQTQQDDANNQVDEEEIEYGDEHEPGNGYKQGYEDQKDPLEEEGLEEVHEKGSNAQLSEVEEELDENAKDIIRDIASINLEKTNTNPDVEQTDAEKVAAEKAKAEQSDQPHPFWRTDWQQGQAQQEERQPREFQKFEGKNWEDKFKPTENAFKIPGLTERPLVDLPPQPVIDPQLISEDQRNAEQHNAEHSDAGQIEAAEPNAAQPNAGQSNVEQSNTAQPNTEQSNAVQDDAGQPSDDQGAPKRRGLMPTPAARLRAKLRQQEVTLAVEQQDRAQRQHRLLRGQQQREQDKPVELGKWAGKEFEFGANTPAPSVQLPTETTSHYSSALFGTLNLVVPAEVPDPQGYDGQRAPRFDFSSADPGVLARDKAAREQWKQEEEARKAEAARKAAETSAEDMTMTNTEPTTSDGAAAGPTTPRAVATPGPGRGQNNPAALAVPASARPRTPRPTTGGLRPLQRAETRPMRTSPLSRLSPTSPGPVPGPLPPKAPGDDKSSDEDEDDNDNEVKGDDEELVSYQKYSKSRLIDKIRYYRNEYWAASNAKEGLSKVVKHEHTNLVAQKQIASNTAYVAETRASNVETCKREIKSLKASVEFEKNQVALVEKRIEVLQLDHTQQKEELDRLKNGRPKSLKDAEKRHNQDKDGFRDQIAKLNESEQQLRGQLDVKSAEADALRSEGQRLIQELENKLSDDAALHEQQAMQMKNNFDQQATQMRIESDQHATQMKNDFDQQATQMKNDFDQQATQMTNEIDQLRTTHEDDLQKMRNATVNFAKLEGERDLLKADAEMAMAETAHFKQELTDKERENEELKSGDLLNKVVHERDNFKAQMDRLNNELTSFHNDLAGKDAELQEMKKVEATLVGEKTDLQNKAFNAQAESVKAVAHMDNLNKTILQHETDITAANKENKTINASLQTSQKTLEALQLEHKTVTSELESVKQKLADAKSKLHAATTEADLQRNKCDDLEAACESHVEQEVYEKCEAELSALQLDVEKLHRDQQEEQTEKDRLQAHIQELEAKGSKDMSLATELKAVDEARGRSSFSSAAEAAMAALAGGPRSLARRRLRLPSPEPEQRSPSPEPREEDDLAELEPGLFVPRIYGPILGRQLDASRKKVEASRKQVEASRQAVARREEAVAEGERELGLWRVGEGPLQRRPAPTSSSATQTEAVGSVSTSTQTETTASPSPSPSSQATQEEVAVAPVVASAEPQPEQAAAPATVAAAATVEADAAPEKAKSVTTFALLVGLVAALLWLAWSYSADYSDAATFRATWEAANALSGIEAVGMRAARDTGAVVNTLPGPVGLSFGAAVVQGLLVSALGSDAVEKIAWVVGGWIGGGRGVGVLLG